MSVATTPTKPPLTRSERCDTLMPVVTGIDDAERTLLLTLDKLDDATAILLHRGIGTDDDVNLATAAIQVREARKILLEAHSLVCKVATR